MLYYNSPESVMAIHDARCASTVNQARRLMRIVRSDSSHAEK